MSLRIFPYVLFCLGALIFYNALGISDSPFQTLGAADYAQGMATLCMGSSLIFILLDWLRCIRRRSMPRLHLPAIRHLHIVTGVMGLLLLYAAGVNYLGYAVSTFCFLMLGMRLLAVSGSFMRDMRVMAPTALLISVVMYYAMRLFNVLLPQALLF